MSNSDRNLAIKIIKSNLMENKDAIILARIIAGKNNKKNVNRHFAALLTDFNNGLRSLNRIEVGNQVVSRLLKILTKDDLLVYGTERKDESSRGKAKIDYFATDLLKEVLKTIDKD